MNYGHLEYISWILVGLWHVVFAIGRYGRLLFLLAFVKIVIVTKYTYGKRLASHDCFVYIYKRKAGHNGKFYIFFTL